MKNNRKIKIEKKTKRKLKKTMKTSFKLKNKWRKDENKDILRVSNVF